MSHDQLSSLSYRQLLAVLRRLCGGSIGFDTARDPRTSTKDALIQHILTVFGDHEIALSDAINEQITLAAATDQSPKLMEKPVTAAPAPKPAAAAGSLDALFAGLVEQAVSGLVEQAVESRMANLTLPRAVQFRQIDSDREPVRIDNAHPLLEKTVKLLAAGLNVLLVGQAGCGKTTLAKQAAEALTVPFHRVPYTAGASESWLLGRYLPTGEGGRFEYQAGRVMEHYQQGGLILHDEIDAADPNMLLILNSLTDNGSFSNPLSNETVCRHQRCYQIGAANTFGTGADAQYVGRNQLDAATLDRWFVLQMDYDQQLESRIAAGLGPQDMATLVCGFVWNLRQKISDKKLRRTASARMIEKGMAALGAGFAWADVKRDLLSGWTRDELSAVGED